MTLKIVKERKSLERIIQIRLLLLKNLFKIKYTKMHYMHYILVERIVDFNIYKRE